jgi:hypothetical protein
MTPGLDDFFEAHPQAKQRLIRALVAVMRTRGQRASDHTGYRFTRRGDWFSVELDGKAVVSLTADALRAVHDA